MKEGELFMKLKKEKQERQLRYVERVLSGESRLKASRLRGSSFGKMRTSNTKLVKVNF